MRRWMLVLCWSVLGCAVTFAQAGYDELAARAMDLVAADSLPAAEAAFKEALRADPSNGRNVFLLSNLGTVQRRLGKADEALESYSLALHLSPRFVPVLLNRASLYLEKNLTQKAYVDYCSVLDTEAANVEALYYRAYIYMDRHQYAEANVDYTNLLTREPGHKMARLGKALCSEALQHYHEALDGLTRLVTDYPDDVVFLKARANVEAEMDTPDLALIDLEQAAKLAPADVEVWVTMGEVYLQQGRWREANRALGEAMRLGYPQYEVRELLKHYNKNNKH